MYYISDFFTAKSVKSIYSDFHKRIFLRMWLANIYKSKISRKYADLQLHVAHGKRIEIGSFRLIHAVSIDNDIIWA